MVSVDRNGPLIRETENRREGLDDLLRRWVSLGPDNGAEVTTRIGGLVWSYQACTQRLLLVKGDNRHPGQDVSRELIGVIELLRVDLEGAQQVRADCKPKARDIENPGEHLGQRGRPRPSVRCSKERNAERALHDVAVLLGVQRGQDEGQLGHDAAEAVADEDERALPLNGVLACVVQASEQVLSKVHELHLALAEEKRRIVSKRHDAAVGDVVGQGIAEPQVVLMVLVGPCGKRVAVETVDCHNTLREVIRPGNGYGRGGKSVARGNILNITTAGAVNTGV